MAYQKETKTKKIMTNQSNEFNVTPGQVLHFENKSGGKFTRVVRRCEEKSLYFSQREDSTSEFRESWSTFNNYLKGKDGIKKIN